METWIIAQTLQQKAYVLNQLEMCSIFKGITWASVEF